MSILCFNLKQEEESKPLSKQKNSPTTVIKTCLLSEQAIKSNSNKNSKVLRFEIFF